MSIKSSVLNFFLCVGKDGEQRSRDELHTLPLTLRRCPNGRRVAKDEFLAKGLLHTGLTYTKAKLKTQA